MWCAQAEFFRPGGITFGWVAAMRPVLCRAGFVLIFVSRLLRVGLGESVMLRIGPADRGDNLSDFASRLSALWAVSPFASAPRSIPPACLSFALRDHAADWAHGRVAKYGLRKKCRCLRQPVFLSAVWLSSPMGLSYTLIWSNRRSPCRSSCPAGRHGPSCAG